MKFTKTEIVIEDVHTVVKKDFFNLQGFHPQIGSTVEILEGSEFVVQNVHYKITDNSMVIKLQPEPARIYNWEMEQFENEGWEIIQLSNR